MASFAVLWVCLGVANVRLFSFWTVFAGFFRCCMSYGGEGGEEEGGTLEI